MKVTQILPAQGWFAVFAVRTPGGDVRLLERPLVCWALLHDERAAPDDIGETIQGQMINDRGKVEPVEEKSSPGWVIKEFDAEDTVEVFLGYLRNDQDGDRWKARARGLFDEVDKLRAEQRR